MEHISFSLSCHKITLFDKKYDIRLVTLISMSHLKPLVSLVRFIKIKMQMYKLLFVLTLFKRICDNSPFA